MSSGAAGAGFRQQTFFLPRCTRVVYTVEYADADTNCSGLDMQRLRARVAVQGQRSPGALCKMQESVLGSSETAAQKTPLRTDAPCRRG